MPLVIKQWSIAKAPTEKTLVKIVGREEGIISWAFSLLGIDPTTSIFVTSEVIEFERGSMAGFEKRVIPIQKICSSYYGYTKPWQVALLITVILLPIFGLGLLVGPLYFFLNKSLSLGFVEDSGLINGIEFKRSVIENVEISEEQARAVVNFVRKIIESRSGGHQMGQSAIQNHLLEMKERFSVEEIEAPNSCWQCPKCQSKNSNRDFKCQKCGFQLK